MVVCPVAKEREMMLAFVIPNPGDTHGEVMKIPKPTPEAGFALIKVLRAGVCNTDLEILQGYMGFHGVLGHEFVGIVEEVNGSDEMKEEWIGKRVCGDINVGTVLGILNRNGTLAEYLTLPVSNLHVVPDDMPDEDAVFAEPLAAACRIPEQGLVYYDKQRPDKVAILGDGKLGLMIAEVLGREHTKHFGGTDTPKPILFGKHQHKLDLVKDSGVIGKLVSECQDDKAFNGVSPAHSGQYDVVVDATGSPAGLSLASGLCRPMGTLVLKSTCAAGEQFNAAPFVIDELKVVGSRCGPIDKALELLAVKPGGTTEPLRVAKYITKTFPLSQADEAIKCAAQKTTMKVQIICGEEK